ncbi:MAG: quinone-dependent dihydroorotate dehydrogenase, partial [Verrucomicrobia bacterium]|nr:quinone-dependent dihydroorotate dehydrogenase [Verrucomicrobiota bacterium]
MCKWTGTRAYEQIFRPLLFSLDPETAHHLTLAILSLLSRFPILLESVSDQVRAERQVFGIRFPNPVGLAAGFDKNAVAVTAWHALGFGFVEVGTITAQSQPGNPRPRIFRIPELEAIVNRLGFNNDGAEKVANRLGNYHNRKAPLGINIGKTRSVPLEAAVADYLATFRRMQDLGDYFVLNVSSPNTPGLRELQERQALKDLLSAIQRENASKPLLVKIAPDLDRAQIDAVIEV